MFSDGSARAAGVKVPSSLFENSFLLLRSCVVARVASLCERYCEEIVSASIDPVCFKRSFIKFDVQTLSQFVWQTFAQFFSAPISKSVLTKMLVDQPSWDILEWFRLADYNNPKDIVGHHAEQLEYIYQKYKWSPYDGVHLSRRDIFDLSWFIRENPRLRTVKHGCGITNYRFYKRGDGLMDKAASLAARMNEIFWHDRL